MPDLSDLIARVEAASGPDRELDALIDCAIRFPALRPARPFDHKEHQRGFPPSKGDIWCPTGFLMARSYTRSIDDALTLLPDSLRVNWAGECPDRRWFCELIERNGPYVGPRLWAATAPLALLSATLKARQASTEEARK